MSGGKRRGRARGGMLGRSYMNEGDYTFLDELYFATNGVTWDNNLGWDRRMEHPLGCFGVTAAVASGAESGHDRDHGGEGNTVHRLSGLDLRGNNLRWVGNFPTLSDAERELFKIMQATSGNKRAVRPPIRPDGHLPDSIGNCRGLVELDLRRNRMRGTIPSSIGQCVNLKRINLYANCLSGPIPESIGQLERLVELRLNQNSLCGPIPATISNCGRLVKLFLASNKLSGGIPRGLCMLRRLESLDLSDNQLSGEIPHEIGDLVLLSEIGLSGNPELITPFEVKPKVLVTKAMQKALDAHMYMDQGSNDDKLTQQEKEGKKLDVDNPDAVVAYYGEVLRNERDNGPSRLCIVS